MRGNERGSVGLAWLVAAAIVLRGLRRRTLPMPAAEIRTIRTVAATTTMATTATMSEAILSLTLVVSVRSRVLLRLTAATGNESGKTTNILSAFMSRLARLLV